jgi:hypothetical protein
MSPRPVHRWKSFWFGVLVLAFLGWAWLRSMDVRDSASWRSHGGQSCCEVSNYHGEVGLVWGDPGTVGLYLPGIAFFSDSDSGDDWFPIASLFSLEEDMSVLLLAHWFLILLFLLPWTAFLFWRIRRMKRLAAEAGETQL